MDPTRPQTITEKLADRAGIEAALRKAGQAAVLEHAHAGFPVATWKDGKVVWLQPEEILAQQGKALGEQANGVSPHGANGHQDHPRAT